MKNTYSFLIRPVLRLFILFMLVSCSAVKILSTNSDPSFSISNYKTFGFYRLDADTVVLSVYAKRIEWIKDEISKQLAAKGLTKSDNPDLYVNIGIIIEEKVQTRDANIRTDMHYMGQRNYTWSASPVEVSRYKEGTVTIELVDRSKNALMWNSVAQSVIEKKDETSKKNIAEATPKMFLNLK
jgi:hypothetical protein